MIDDRTMKTTCDDGRLPPVVPRLGRPRPAVARISVARDAVARDVKKFLSVDEVIAVARAKAAEGCTVNEAVIEVLEAGPLLFNTCNTDGTAGFTWGEVQKCIENFGVLPELEGLIPTSEADFNLLAGGDLILSGKEWKAW